LSVASRIIITTSRRPTPTVRRFIKHLVSVLPNAKHQTRGKLTLSMLALLSLDLNIDKVLIIRNRKGNPGYIDVYQVDHISRSLVKVCTIPICGYSLNKPQNKTSIKNGVKYIIVGENSITNIDDETLECIFAAFNVQVHSEKTRRQSNRNDYVILYIKEILRKAYNENPVYEVQFKNAKNEVLSPVIRICKAKIYTRE